MARREYVRTVRCAEQGCRESQAFVADTRREEAESIQSQQRWPWKCQRHSQPEKVLSTGNPRRELTFVVSQRPWEYYERDKAEYEREIARGAYPRPRPAREFWDGLWWHDGKTWHSTLYGEGFKAFAVDYPMGTKLHITVEVEVPDASH